MKRINNSNFDLIQNIINEIDFNYDASNTQAKEELFGSWKEVMGDKISKFSKASEVSNDGVLTVLCADSFVANELYFEKDKILLLMQEKAEKLGINIKDIKFDYKKWKEQVYE